jgi:hypothetical protein
MTARPRSTAIAVATLIAIIAATPSANAADCTTIYGVATNDNVSVAISRARRDAVRRAGRRRGGIISAHIDRRRISRSPTLWRVYYRARVCSISRAMPPRRFQRPVLRRFR